MNTVKLYRIIMIIYIPLTENAHDLDLVVGKVSL